MFTEQVYIYFCFCFYTKISSSNFKQNVTCVVLFSLTCCQQNVFCCAVFSYLCFFIVDISRE